MPDSLMINEVFFSIQGEGTRAGMPCVFVRLTGCHLRCHYCDTEYAFHEGRKRELDAILNEVETLAPGCELVQVTGGEPLLQPAVHPLMRRLCDLGRTVLLETSGACDISTCDPRVVRILDLKTPGSGECERNLWSNLDHLTPRDEIKIVICSRRDYEWARDTIRERDLAHRSGAVLLGAVESVAPGRELPGATGLPLRDLAKWVLEDGLPVRLQVQLHKLIWDPAMRGV